MYLLQYMFNSSEIDALEVKIVEMTPFISNSGLQILIYC